MPDLAVRRIDPTLDVLRAQPGYIESSAFAAGCAIKYTTISGRA
jgi:hypothetical protein